MKKIHRPSNTTYDSAFEQEFHQYWKNHSNIPIVFHHNVVVSTGSTIRPTRKWELDFAFPQFKLAIELQGFGTGHISYKGMLRDYLKHNDLILHGWFVLYFMSKTLKDEPRKIISTIERAIELRAGKTDFNLPPSGHERPKSNPLLDAGRAAINKRFN